MKNLIKELNEAQAKTIGLLKNRYSKELELVIEKDDVSVKTIHIGSLFGFSESNYPASHINDYGRLKMFPDGKTMAQMKEDIYAFNDFVKEFD